jgi:hypothetical protein
MDCTLRQKGVDLTGIIDTGYGPTVVFRDPDNLQLEFSFMFQPTKKLLS